jgi:hypothetical protein
MPRAHRERAAGVMREGYYQCSGNMSVQGYYQYNGDMSVIRGWPCALAICAGTRLLHGR